MCFVFLAPFIFTIGELVETKGDDDSATAFSFGIELGDGKRVLSILLRIPALIYKHSLESPPRLIKSR